jgi:hypothetical protein
MYMIAPVPNTEPTAGNAHALTPPPLPPCAPQSSSRTTRASSWRTTLTIEAGSKVDQAAEQNRELATRLQITTEELAGLRAELSDQYDRAAQHASKELREQMGGAELRALQAEGIAKQQARELELVVGRCDEMRAELSAAAAARADAESGMKEAEWELRDQKHAADSMQVEMEWQYENLKAKMASTIAELEGKMTIVVRSAFSTEIYTRGCHWSTPARLK